MAHTKINRIEYTKRHTRRTFDQDDLVFASYLILKAPIHFSETHLYFKTSSLLSHDCSIEHAKYCVVNPKESSVLMYGALLFLCRLSSGVFLECCFLSPPIHHRCVMDASRSCGIRFCHCCCSCWCVRLWFWLWLLRLRRIEKSEQLLFNNNSWL